MIQFVAVILLLPLILCQKTQFAKYENINGVNSQNCEISSDWNRVVYKNIEIVEPYLSPSGLRASEISCTSFPIFLEPESILHFIVYVKTRNINSGIVILVNLQENGTIARLVYNRATDNYVEGWNEISLQVNNNGHANIDLLGYSGDNETVLFDSVFYTYNKTALDTTADKGFIKIVDEKHVEVKRHNMENNSSKSDMKGNSNEETNEFLRLENTHFRNSDEPYTLGIWAIVLISLGCVTVTALVAVCAYYLGKYRRAPKVIPVVYDVEPPKVDMLPRVRGTVEPFNYNFES